MYHTTFHRQIWGIIAAALLAACHAEPPAQAEPRPVRTVVLGRTVGGGTLTFTAEVRARYETDLAFQVSGKMIVRFADTGTAVRRGQVLARIEDQDLRTALDAARASVAAAAAQLARARADEIRFRDLLERGLTTRSAYQAQQTSTRTAQSQLEQAQAELQLRTQQIAYAVLRAGRDGVITRTLQNPGAVVGAGEPVLTLAEDGGRDLVFDVAEGQVDAVRAAGQVEVTDAGATTAASAAVVREVAPSADPRTGTYRVRAGLAEGGRGLKLGRIVTVVTRIEDAAEAALAIPPTAVFQHDGEPALWIVGMQNRLELRPVKVLRYDADRVLIAAGAWRGERVVTAGVNQLAAGATVRLLEDK
jgi:membrane fusion protein, multidrug efflux system